MADSTANEEAFPARGHGHAQGAEALFHEVLDFGPFRADFLINLSVLLEQNGRRHEAIRLYEEGIRRAPCLEFYVNLGALWISERRPDLAAAPLQKAVELDADCVPAHVNLAGAHSMLGNDAEALTSYRKAIELDPDNPETLTRFAAFLGQLGQTDEAAALYLKLLSVRPSAEQFVKFGDCLMAAGRTPEAAGAYRQAVALNEHDGLAHFSLANALQELTDAASARRHFAHAAQLRPDKPLWRLRAEICGPVVFESGEEIEGYLARVERAVEEVEESKNENCKLQNANSEGSQADGTRSGPATLSDILEARVFPSLSPSSLGRNPRRVREQFAALYEPYFRDVDLWSAAACRRFSSAREEESGGKRPQSKFEGKSGGKRPHSERARVGFLVTRRHEGMFLQSMRGIIEKLDNQRIESVILCSQASAAALRTGIRRDGLRYVAFRDTFDDAVRTIRAAACDLIYYWEV